MPRLSMTAAKTAIITVGTIAIALKIDTSRTCSTAPASPRRLSAQSLQRRHATSPARMIASTTFVPSRIAIARGVTAIGWSRL